MSNQPAPVPPYRQVPEPAAISPDGASPVARSQAPVGVFVRLTPGEHADLARLAESKHCSLPDVLRAGLHLFTATETP